jgi:hypothetical protein
MMLGACLTSSPPRIERQELAQLDGLIGHYDVAITSASNGRKGAMEIKIEAGNDGAYSIVTIENGAPQEKPMLLSVLDLKPDVYLGVIGTNPEAETQLAMYAFVSRVAEKDWSVKLVEIGKNARNSALAAVAKRHGIEDMSFRKGLGQATDDVIEGEPTGSQLRTLFNDPEFAAAIEPDIEMRLTAKPN